MKSDLPPIWPKAQTIAEVLIALAAVVAIGLTVQQGCETRRVIKAAAESFEAQAYPVVKFSGYRWDVLSAPAPSCENPPFGAEFSLHHSWGAPVMLGKRTWRFFIGQKPIFNTAEQVESVDTDTILAMGDDSHIHVYSADTLRDIYPRLLIDRQPKMRVLVDATYRSIATGRTFEYHAEIQLNIDCRGPGRDWVALKESTSATDAATKVKAAVP